MPRKRKSVVLETVKTTSGKTFSKTVTKTGKTIHRINGKFASAKSYRSASSSASVRERRSLKTSEVDIRAPARTFRDMTVKVGDKWVAGEDARRYLPSVKEGDELTKAQQKTLREIRLAERNFWSFARLKTNKGLSREEIEKRYQKFAAEIDKAKSRRASRAVVDRFWNTAYGKNDTGNDDAEENEE